MPAIRSMTGYGEATFDLGPAGASRPYRVAIRSVNHRHLDIRVRLGRELSALEPRVHALVKERVKRGHVEVIIEPEPGAGGGARVVVDEVLTRELLVALHRVRDLAGLEGQVTLADVLRFPDVCAVVTSGGGALDEPQAELAVGGVSTALDRLVAMREAEGRRLADELLLRVGLMREMVRRVEQGLPRAVEAIRARLDRRIQDVLGGSVNVDPQRLLQEVAFMADKSDVSEEIGRLRSHLAEVERQLEMTSHARAGEHAGSGKKLEFLTQELHRELNTMGSKLGDADLVRLVIDGKCEVEKVREQVANLE